MALPFPRVDSTCASSQIKGSEHGGWHETIDGPSLGMTHRVPTRVIRGHSQLQQRWAKCLRKWRGAWTLVDGQRTFFKLTEREKNFSSLLLFVRKGILRAIDSQASEWQKGDSTIKTYKFKSWLWCILSWVIWNKRLNVSELQFIHL